MATWLKQSTAVDIAFGPFLDDTDGKTAETALTLSQADIRLKKNAGDWAQKNESTSATHEENGWYEVKLDATDTGTLGILIVAAHESGALPVWREFLVVPANEYDSFILGTDALDVEVASMAAGTVTAAAIASNAIDADALASDAVNEIADQVWEEALADHSGTAGSAAEALDAVGTPATASAIADAVWDEALAGHAGAGSTGKALSDIDSATDAGTLADAVWDEALAELSAVPAIDGSMRQAMAWLLTLARNKRTQTTSTEVVYKDDGTTQLATSTKSDSAGTFTRGEYS